MALSTEKHHGSAGEGQRKEHGGRGDHEVRVQPVNHHPVASPQSERPIFTRKDAPHNHKPSSETQPPSCPPSPLAPPTSHPPAHLEPSAHPLPSIRPSAQGPRPCPRRQVFTASSVSAVPFRGLGHSGRQSRLVSGQPELLESQMAHRDIKTAPHRRPPHANVPWGHMRVDLGSS